jgi:S-DNA-T family DNA segregation ATPase FtsK/SpoIIIE
MLVWAAKDAGYVLGYHAVRSPKYAAKASVYAPVGFFRATGKLLQWASAEQGNWALRQRARPALDQRGCVHGSVYEFGLVTGVAS